MHAQNERMWYVYGKIKLLINEQTYIAFEFQRQRDKNKLLASDGVHL